MCFLLLKAFQIWEKSLKNIKYLENKQVNSICPLFGQQNVEKQCNKHKAVLMESLIKISGFDKDKRKSCSDGNNK